MIALAVLQFGNGEDINSWLNAQGLRALEDAVHLQAILVDHGW